MANTVMPFANKSSLKQALDKRQRVEHNKNLTLFRPMPLEVTVSPTLAEFGANNDTVAIFEFPDSTYLLYDLVEIECLTDGDVQNDTAVDLVISDDSAGATNAIELIGDSTVLRAAGNVDVSDAPGGRAFRDVSNKFLVLILDTSALDTATSFKVRLNIARSKVTFS